MYVADALLFQRDQPVHVDLYDRLPTPFGLLRYGVAPDHLKMKSLARPLQRVLDDPRVRFFGNVEVGRDITVDELRSSYHAVVYTFGASTDRRMDIPGEELPGSWSATDLVSWYSGHPDALEDRFDLSAVSTAVVVGVGNVAVDVSRILTKSVDALAATDMPQPVIDRLSASAITDVHVLGRRGPVHARFTAKELRELGELEGVDIVVDPAQLELGVQDLADLTSMPALAKNLAILTEWSERPLTGAPCRLHLRFWSRPLSISGSTCVESVQIEPTTILDGRVVGHGPAVDLPAQLVLRSVGYRGIPIPGVPFDADSGTIPHDQGRVLRDGRLSPAEYVAGWVGRGPVGILGTNRSDAEGVVERLLEDAGELLSTDPVGPAAEALLGARGVELVDVQRWSAIDSAEVALGQTRGRPRTKLHTWSGLLDASRAYRGMG